MYALSDIRSKIFDLDSGLVTLGRYWLFSVLAAVNYEEKLAAAEAASITIDAAGEIRQFAWRQYHCSRRRVRWPDEYVPSAYLSIPMLDADPNIIAAVRANVYSAVEASFQELLRISCASPELTPLHRKLSAAFNLIERYHGSKSERHPSEVLLPKHSPPTKLKNHRSLISKVFDGPSRTKIDPVFIPAYSCLSYRSPIYSDRLADALPYYWTLATREAMAADSCALSAIEYDGLPLDFYRDMAKQCWDEARHSTLFLSFCQSMAPVLAEELSTGSPLLPILHRFMTTRTGLPIPKEGNFYEVMWQADLIERLILMQIETESPAVKVLALRAKGPLCEHYPELKTLVEIDRNDEISHARIGHFWFRYLVPREIDRQSKREIAGLLRGIFFASFLASRKDVPVSDLIESFSSDPNLAGLPSPIDAGFIS